MLIHTDVFDVLPAFGNLAAIVSRGVVHNNNLVRDAGLRQHRIEAFSQITGVIVAWNYNRNLHPNKPLPAIRRNGPPVDAPIAIPIMPLALVSTTE